jgi:hypothetical protein
LLRADLFQDVWHHILQLLGLRVSSNNHKILTHWELNYKREVWLEHYSAVDKIR